MRPRSFICRVTVWGWQKFWKTPRGGLKGWSGADILDGLLRLLVVVSMVGDGKRGVGCISQSERFRLVVGRHESEVMQRRGGGGMN